MRMSKSRDRDILEVADVRRRLFSVKRDHLISISRYPACASRIRQMRRMRETCKTVVANLRYAALNRDSTISPCENHLRINFNVYAN